MSASNLRRRTARGLRAAAPLAPGVFLARGSRTGVLTCPLTAALLLFAGTALLFVRPSVAADPVPAAAESHEDDTAWDGMSDGMSPGIPLQPDRSLRRLLIEADEFASEGRYEEAVELWQRALDYAGHTMAVPEPHVFRTLRNDEYQVFRPVRHQIEARIRELPEDALRLYRLRADGEARGLISSAAGNVEPARRAVVRRYFLSDIGDDAAWHLAVRSFDRHDFVSAQRLLRRLLDEHPDSDVPREWLLLRMTVAGDRLGDDRDARAAWREFELLGGGDVPVAVRRAVEQQLASDRPARSSRSSAPAGETIRTVSLVAESDDGPVTLTEGWVAPFDHRMTESDPESVTAGTVSISAVNGSTIGQPAREELIEEWSRHGWVPAGEPVIVDGRIYFYGTEHVTCCAVDDGRLLWRSTHGTEYKLDPLSRSFALARADEASPERPTSFAGVRLFGDRVHPQLTVADGRLHCLEGRVLDYGSHSIGTAAVTNGANSQQRCRENRLTTYDARTGKLLWSRQAVDATPDDPNRRAAGFLGAPVAHQGRLFAVTSESGELRLLSMDAATGETLWNEFLCDEPFTGASPWSPVGIVAEGDDIYVAPGTGLVFALDAQTGLLHWATRYDRNGVREEPEPGRFRQSTAVSSDPDGWQADVLVAHGRCLVVLPSDAGRLFALDRTDGSLLWDSPRSPFENGPAADRVLGTAGEGLFVSGPQVVRRYDMTSGRLVWEMPLEQSCGIGAVGAGVLVVPDGQDIVQLAPDTGRELARAHFLTTTDEPVGNLKIAAGRLFVAGCERIFALTPLSRRMTELASAIDQGDGEACLTRMRLNARRSERDAALDDLRRAYELRRVQGGVDVARRLLVDGLAELSIPDARPLLTIAWLTDDAITSVAQQTEDNESIEFTGTDEARGRAESEKSEKSDSPRRSAVLYTVLASLRSGLETVAASDDPAALASRSERGREVIRLLLEGGPLWRQDGLEEQAARTVAALASTADAPVLLEALDSPDATTRLLAVEGLAQFAEAHADRLAEAVSDPSEAIRYRAAVAQLNLGRRDALNVLVELLHSDELPVRTHAAAALRNARGDSFAFAFAAYDPVAERKRAADQWAAWVAGEGRTAKLHLPIATHPTPAGRIIVANNRTQRIYELDAADVESDPVWKQEGLRGIWSVRGTPDGYRVATTTNPRSVTVYDADGQEVWQVKDLPGSPFSAQLLPNGHLLVACNSRKILEYRRGEGDAPPELVRSWDVPGVPQCVERLDNGHTLVAITNPGQVIQYDLDWKPVRHITGLGNPVSAQRLPNGHILVADSQSRSVSEFGPEGQRLVWSQPWQRSRIYSAQRTPNGLTLIVDDQGLALIDSNHNTVAERKDPGLRCAESY